MAIKPKKNASPDDLRKGLKNVNRAMGDLMAMRSKAEIPAWERKEMREAMQLERAKKKRAEAAKKASVTKASAAPKAGAKNKMKAQGAKAMGAPTSGYGKTTKKK